MIEIMTKVGRLVNGHPLNLQAMKNEDKVTKVKTPRLDNSGAQMYDSYVAIAIAKTGETDWKQTDWGQQIYNQAVNDFPNGEHAMAAFSWKIVDGDSQVPNKNMRKPCDQEGYPGHWVIHCNNIFKPIKCYNVGKYDPMTDQISDKKMIKRGDYCRLILTVKGNNAVHPNTPGVFITPVLFELYRAGEEIYGENEPDAQSTFGSDPGQLPANALVDTNMPATAATTNQPGNAPPPPPAQDAVKPAHDFADAAPPPPTVVVKYMYSGKAYTLEQLVSGGHDTHVVQNTYQKAPQDFDDDIPF